MIRLLFLIMIAAVVLLVAIFQFKAISLAKKMATAGGAIAAAAIGVLMQAAFPWYLALLALLAVSLLASLVYMKILQREESEKLLLAEERKIKRQTLIMPSPTESQDAEEIREELNAAKETEMIPVRETIKNPETVKVRETIQLRETVKQPETIKAHEAVKEPETIKVRETIPMREMNQQKEKELETVPAAKPAEMQSIQLVRKGQ